MSFNIFFTGIKGKNGETHFGYKSFDEFVCFGLTRSLKALCDLLYLYLYAIHRIIAILWTKF